MFSELFTQNCSVTMGKKMGMNSKAVAAKERKHGKAAAEKAQASKHRLTGFIKINLDYP